MVNTITKKATFQPEGVPAWAQAVLRLHYGSLARVARRLRPQVSRAMMVFVLNGERNSKRVARALIREATRLARKPGSRSVLSKLRLEAEQGDARAAALVESLRSLEYQAKLRI